MSTDAMQTAIDRIENDSEFARLVYGSSHALPSEYDLTAEECAAVRDPLILAIDRHLGEVQGFVTLGFGTIKIVYTPQKPDGTLSRDPQSGLPTGQRVHKPMVTVTDIGH